ncbi:MAG: hypothetical protein Q9193_006974, partial [Seirophora villosa]
MIATHAEKINDVCVVERLDALPVKGMMEEELSPPIGDDADPLPAAGDIGAAPAPAPAGEEGALAGADPPAAAGGEPGAEPAPPAGDMGISPPAGAEPAPAGDMGIAPPAGEEP